MAYISKIMTLLLLAKIDFKEVFMIAKYVLPTLISPAQKFQE